MTDKKMRQSKEIAQGVAGKYETTPTVKGKKNLIAPQNKKCGGMLKKKK
jgi:hypothetical protein